MVPSPHVIVRIDLARVRASALAIRARAGVDVLAVVKADAYGFGAAAVVRAIDDVVDGYCFFSLAEILACDLRALTAKPAITFGPPGDADAALYRQHRVRPAVASVDDARRYRSADPILSVDTGMQRFACPPGDLRDALRAGGCREAMTHARTPDQVQRLLELTKGETLRLHAAGSSLLHEPAARLDAVRPGIALYAGAARVSTRLFEARDAAGPAGYSGFASPTGRHGVILCGYAKGLRPGPCLVDGCPSQILEVGMQSAFVACPPGARAGAEVVMLGEGVTESAVAEAWGASPHVVLVQLAGAGVRKPE